MIQSFINKNGTLPRIIYSIVVAYMRKTKGKLITLTYKAVVPTRSLLQNRYYWGVVIKMLAEEIGYHSDAMHQYMKELFLSSSYLGMPDGEGVEIYPSTKTLSTKQFDDYIQAVRIWGGEFLCLHIPLPNQTEFDYTRYE